MFFNLLFFIIYSTTPAPCLELQQKVTAFLETKEQVNTHCVSLQKDKTATIKIEQHDKALFIEVFQPNGDLLKRHINTNFLWDETILEITAPVDGTYVIKVKSLKDPEGVNHYSMTMVSNLSPIEIKNQEKQLMESLVFKQLKANTHEVNSADVKDDDFSDLQALKAAIGDSRIVLLGEGTHRDGSTLKMKARLIKFLNEEMGFNILAFESGFYELFRHRELENAGEDVNWTNLIFGATSKTKEFQDTIDILKNAKNPLVYWGIDIQFSRPYGQFFFTDLKNTLENKPMFNLQEHQIFKKVFTFIDNESYGEKATKPTEDEVQVFWAVHLRYTEAITSLENKSEKEKVLLQALKSLQAYAKILLKAVPNVAYGKVRDQQMADNALWIANQLRANSKMIIWGATAHIFRPFKKVTSAGYSFEFKTLGDHIFDHMGEKAYAIGFTSSQGEFGWDTQKKRAGEKWSARQIKPNIIEALEMEEYLALMDIEYGFFDFRSANFDWIKKPQYTRVQGHYPSLAVWPDVLDGLIYIKTMEVSHKIEEKKK